MPTAMAGSKGAAGVGRGRPSAAGAAVGYGCPCFRMQRSAVASSDLGGHTWRKTTRLQPRAVGVRKTAPDAAVTRRRYASCKEGHRASVRKHDPRACGRHADRTKTRNGYPKIDRVWRTWRPAGRAPPGPATAPPADGGSGRGRGSTNRRYRYSEHAPESRSPPGACASEC
jgi:hypothetical protein